MIILSALVGLAGALVAALVLGWAMKAVCSRLNPAEAYYISGGAFAAALAVTPALFLAGGLYGARHPAEFSTVFPLIAVLFAFYPWLARTLGIQRWNVAVMLLLTLAAAVAAVLFRIRADEIQVDAWAVLIYGTAAVGLLLIHLAVAAPHQATAFAYSPPGSHETR